MKKYRSSITTEGKTRAGARALWRANGMQEDDFKKPIIAIVNSFTQFVPGHVHLREIGKMVKEMIDQAGGFGAEMNTIAIDDGIAMGHNGMLYSLPSRDLIADSVEYMINAHAADAMICIPNCDKIVPGMMMAAMRLNIPTLFVSGGPMEAGQYKGNRYDLIEIMKLGGDSQFPEQELSEVEKIGCPTCGSCSGMFTANSMNCLAEALGIAYPGNGTLVATHEFRKKLYEKAAQRIVKMAEEYYLQGNDNILPRSIITQKSCRNAMALDIAMGGSTNTVLHLLAVAREGEIDFTMKDIDLLSRKVPSICKVAPNTSQFYIEDVNRAGGVMSIMGQLLNHNLIHEHALTIEGKKIGSVIRENDITSQSVSQSALERAYAAPCGYRNLKGMSQNNRYQEIDRDRQNGCIRDCQHAYFQDGGLAVLYGNIALDGCIVKTAGVDPSIFQFSGRARVFDSQEIAVKAILGDQIKKGDVIIIRYEGPKGGPGMQEMLYPTTYLKSKKLDKDCALLTDGRFSGGTSGLSIGHISPEAASGGMIALVEEGDKIEIDIPSRKISLSVSEQELEKRRLRLIKCGGYQPQRDRKVSKTLKLYGRFATSADKGAVRDWEKV